MIVYVFGFLIPFVTEIIFFSVFVEKSVLNTNPIWLHF